MYEYLWFLGFHVWSLMYDFGFRDMPRRILWRIDLLLGNDSVNIFPREPTHVTIGRLLLGNGSVQTPETIRDNRRRCFLWCPPRGYITRRSKGAVSCRESGRILEMAILHAIPNYVNKVSINSSILSRTSLKVTSNPIHVTYKAHIFRQQSQLPSLRLLCVGWSML
jgi:hypothetical protein